MGFISRFGRLALGGEEGTMSPTDVETPREIKIKIIT